MYLCQEVFTHHGIRCCRKQLLLVVYHGIFAHQRAPHSMAHFGTHNNDRRNGSVKKEVLVTRFLRVTRQFTQFERHDAIRFSVYFHAHETTLAGEKKTPLCYITYISDGLGWVPEVGFWDYTTQNQSAQLAMNPIFWLNSGYIPQNSTLGTKSITSPYTYTLYIVVSLIQESDPKKNYTQLTSNCMIFSCQGKK